MCSALPLKSWTKTSQFLLSVVSILWQEFFFCATCNYCLLSRGLFVCSHNGQSSSAQLQRESFNVLFQGHSREPLGHKIHAVTSKITFRSVAKTVPATYDCWQTFKGIVAPAQASSSKIMFVYPLPAIVCPLMITSRTSSSFDRSNTMSFRDGNDFVRGFLPDRAVDKTGCHNNYRKGDAKSLHLCS